MINVLFSRFIANLLCVDRFELENGYRETIQHFRHFQLIEIYVLLRDVNSSICEYIMQALIWHDRSRQMQEGFHPILARQMFFVQMRKKSAHHNKYASAVMLSDKSLNNSSELIHFEIIWE